MDASITTSLALHGRIAGLDPSMYGEMSPALSRCWTTARTSTKLLRITNIARKMIAKAIRNMHVPAYCPVELGVQDIEKRGVAVEVKKVMAIESIPIISMLDEDDIGMEPAVEGAIGIAGIVSVADPAIDIVVPDIDMPSMLTRQICDVGR